MLTYYANRHSITRHSKTDNSPVTEADLAAHRHIVAGLAEHGWPVLSEECSSGQADRHGWSRFWLVDPLDGTREFLGGTGDFTINIALVDAGDAVLGLVAHPPSDAIYIGGSGVGAWCFQDGKRQRLTARSSQASSALTVLASRRHRNPEVDACITALRHQGAEPVLDNVGSALKFCRLAEGKADFYPRYAPCYEWDTAAGQALLEGAGGAVWGLDGLPLRYNQRETLASPPFHAVADPAAAYWSRLR